MVLENFTGASEYGEGSLSQERDDGESRSGSQGEWARKLEVRRVTRRKPG